MKTKKIKVFHIYAQGVRKVVEVNKDTAFKEIRDSIGADVLEMHLVNIRGIRYYICIDEEGRLTDRVATAFSERYGALVGDVVIAHFQDLDTDEWLTLTQSEIDNLQDRVRTALLSSGDIISYLGDSIQL